MNLVKLRFSMIGTIALLIIVSTVFFAILLSFFGVGNLLSLAFMVILSNLAQWLFAPQMINSMYKVKEISKTEDNQIHDTVERLSQRIGLKMPKVMMANMPIPNAFAYGSPIGGNRVAVTKGLLKNVAVEKIKDFEEAFLMELEQKHPEVLKVLKEGNLSDEATSTMEKLAAGLVGQFK